MYYSLLPHESRRIVNRLNEAFEQYPWQGGYSAVNFYNKLKYTVASQNRPNIVSMQYSSPGWIELSLLLGVAVTIQKVIKAITQSIRDVHGNYNEIYSGMYERKLLRLEAERQIIALDDEKSKFIDRSATILAEVLYLDNVDAINRRTGSSYKTLKILLSLYRRIKILADFEQTGKTRMTEKK